MSPAFIVRPIRFWIPGFEFLPASAFKRARAVVATEHEQRIVELIRFLQLTDDTADVLVQTIHHSRESGHSR